MRTVRDSTKKIVWQEEDDQAWETVSEPGGVDQQLLLLRHSKDEAETQEGEQQPDLRHGALLLQAEAGGHSVGKW